MQGQIEGLGDIRHGATIELVQDKDDATLQWQLLERAPDNRARVLALLGAPIALFCERGGEVILGDFAKIGGLALVVERDAISDPEQPGAQRPGSVEVIELAVHHHEHVMRHILDVALLDTEPAQRSIDIPELGFVELSKCHALIVHMSSREMNLLLFASHPHDGFVVRGSILSRHLEKNRPALVRCMFASLLISSCWAPCVAFARPDAQARASLDTDLSREASACVTQDVLRERVSARLGYDPFDADAPLNVHVKITANEDTYTALISTQRDASLPRERALESSGCQDLIEATVFAVALAIDPVRSMKPPPNHARQPLHEGIVVAAERSREAALADTISRARSFREDAKTIAAEAAIAQTPAVVEPVPSTSEVRITGGIGGRVNEAPTVNSEVAVGVEVAWPRSARIGLSLGSAIPITYRAAGGTVTLSTQRLDLSACKLFGRGILSACGLVSPGLYTGRGNGYEQARVERAPLFGAGARFGLEWMFLQHLGARANIESMAMLTQAHWKLDPSIPLHSTPRWNAAGRIEIIWRLPSR